MDWTTVIGPIVGIMGTAATIVIRRFSMQSLKSPRARLKDDLEILHLLEERGYPGEIVRKHVDTLLRKTYEEADNGITPYNIPLFILGIIALAGFIAWSVWIVNDGFSWWVIGTGFGA